MMTTLYDVVQNVVTKGIVTKKGVNFYVETDLAKGNIKAGGTPFMEFHRIVPQVIHFYDNSVIEVSENMELLPGEILRIPPFEALENLYKDYFKSTPCSIHGKEHFYAVPEEKLTFSDYENGIERNLAQVRLETFVIFSACLGLFHWENGWYWQSRNYEKLILYKSWAQTERRFNV